jgi:hypothetical protein
MTTFGLPLYLSNLAWQSPKVLDTESLPGITLTGPDVTGPPGPFSMMLLFWYIYPPPFRIRNLSASSLGL